MNITMETSAFRLDAGGQRLMRLATYASVLVALVLIEIGRAHV